MPVLQKLVDSELYCSLWTSKPNVICMYLLVQLQCGRKKKPSEIVLNSEWRNYNDYHRIRVCLQLQGYKTELARSLDNDNYSVSVGMFLQLFYYCRNAAESGSTFVLYGT